MSTNTYICPFHKIEQTGTKRVNFTNDLHNECVNATMERVIKLYKNVIYGCHCQINYTVFDSIMKESSSQPKTNHTLE
jgi:GTP cyclohydrolase I